MAVSHVVLFKWKPEASAEAIRATVEALRGLSSKIPCIKSLHVGESFTSARHKGFTHCLVARLGSRADVDVYGKHPAHVAAVTEHVKPILADIMALDFDGDPADADAAAAAAASSAAAVNAAQQLLEDPRSPFFMAPEFVANGHNQTYSVFVNGPHTMAEWIDDSLAAGAAAGLDFAAYADERLSYAALRRRVDALAAALARDLGVRVGERVAIAMRNYPEWALTFLAVAKLGAVAVPVNSWWTGREMEYGLADSGAKVLVCDQERFDDTHKVGCLGRLGVTPVLVRPKTAASAAAAAAAGAVLFGALLSGRDGEAPPDWGRRVAKDAPAVIMYTSGTTGNPKGVVQTQRGVLAQLKTAVVGDHIAYASGAPRPTTQYCMIATVPLFHVTGSHHIFLSTLAKAGKLVLLYKWDPEVALRMIEKERVTHWTGVPTMVQELLALPGFAAADTSSLKSLGSGGAAMARTTVATMAEKMPKTTGGQGYGLTEVNGGCCSIYGKDYLAKPASTGKPYWYMEARTNDGAGGINVPGASGLPRGELQLRGVLTMREYWNKPEATAKAIDQDGWFSTGDVAEIDAEGFVYIVDRVKDLVIRGGENISCTEVEQAVYEHPGVFEATVFGLPDKRLGEIVGLMVRVKPGQSLDKAALLAFIKEQGKLAKFKMPEQVVFTAAPLARGATGKIQRREIQATVAEQLGLAQKASL